MYKKILITMATISTLTLAGCKTTPVETPKKPFYITTQNIQDFADTISIQKLGKIGGDQELIVASQLSARVQNISYNIGDSVKGGQPIIKLSDDIANYKSTVSRAKTSLDNAILSYEQNTNNIDSATISAKTLLAQAQNNFSSAQKIAEQNIKQVSQALENTSLNQGSPASLNIETIITNIENQINSIKSNYAVQKSTNIGHIEDVLHQIDTIMGVQKSYEQLNDSFEIYLGAKDTTQRQKTEDAIRKLYRTKTALEALPDSELDNAQILESLPSLEESYQQAETLLKMMQTLLKNTISSTVLSQTKIDGYIAIMDGLQSANTAKYGAFVAFQTQVQNFLGQVKTTSTDEEDYIKTLAQQQLQTALKSAKEAQKSANIAYDTTLIGTESSIFNAETALKNAKLSYDTTLANKDNQIGLLKNGITQAKIGYEDALTTYNKLSVRSPIRGTISNIFIDEGQEVGPGTPLFSIISENKQSIEIYITSTEHKLIKENQKVFIMYNDQLLSGKIIGVSTVAGPNTLYKAQIGLDKPADLLGDIATVHIPIKAENITLPINTVTALQDGKGFVYLLSGDLASTDTGTILEPIKTFVDLGKTRNDRIEILSPLPLDATIIASDISNFNPERFQITIKN